MCRLVAAMVDAGDRLLFLFGDPRTLDGVESTDRPALANDADLKKAAGVNINLWAGIGMLVSTSSESKDEVQGE